MPEILLTVGQAAERLAVVPKTIRQMLLDGRLKGIKIGTRWRIREAEIEAFILQGSGSTEA